MALIRFFKPTLRRRDMDAVLQTMVDEKIGPGDRRKEFLRLFAEYIGIKDGITLRSYIDALSFSLRAVGLKSGDKIAVSVLSPEIYRSVSDMLSLELLLCDIDPETGCMSMDAITKAVEAGASAVLLHEPVCQLPSSLVDLPGLGLPVIEDITQSVGSAVTGAEEGKIIPGTKPGTLGSIVVCAFEEDGVISTGGGAVVLSGNETMLEELKKLHKEFSPYIDLPDMNAALGIIQLSNLGFLLSRRSELYKLFTQSLMKTDHRLFGARGIDFVSNGFVFPVVCNGRPDEASQFATKYGVSCKRTFTKSVGARYQDRFDLYPGAVPALSRGLSFPLYPFLQQKDTEAIMKVLSHLP